MLTNDSCKITQEFEVMKRCLSDSYFNIVERDHSLLRGKVAHISANHKSNEGENSSSRIGFILWLTRVLYVTMNDFQHQTFSKEILFEQGGRWALMILKSFSSFIPWGPVLWELFRFQTSDSADFKRVVGFRWDEPPGKQSPLNELELSVWKSFLEMVG